MLNTMGKLLLLFIIFRAEELTFVHTFVCYQVYRFICDL